MKLHKEKDFLGNKTNSVWAGDRFYQKYFKSCHSRLFLLYKVWNAVEARSIFNLFSKLILQISHHIFDYSKLCFLKTAAAVRRKKHILVLQTILVSSVNILINYSKRIQQALENADSKEKFWLKILFLREKKDWFQHKTLLMPRI